MFRVRVAPHFLRICASLHLCILPVVSYTTRTGSLRLVSLLAHHTAGVSSVSTVLFMSLNPPSLADKLLNDHFLISAPFHINRTGPPYAKIEKNAAIPRHHPAPALTIHAGTKNGSVKLKASLYNPMIAADSDACPLKHSMI